MRVFVAKLLLLLASIAYSVNALAEPQIVNPSANSTLSGAQQTFTWTTEGADVERAWLYVGTTLGGREIANSGDLGTNTEYDVIGIPVDGSTVYTRFWYYSASRWFYVDSRYTAADLDVEVSTPAVLSPVNNSELDSARVEFKWSNNNTPVNYWLLYLGTNQGGNDLYDSGVKLRSQTSVTVDAMPLDGSSVHARLWFRTAADGWQYADSVYRTVDVSVIVSDVYLPQPLSSVVTALPNIRGCGVSTTTGGRGGETRFVTNRNDSGPGSFREAVSGNAAKNVMFTIGGDIDISTADLNAGDNTTLWGQTAPGQGVALRPVPNNTFKNAAFQSDANFVMTHMRFRNMPPSVPTPTRDVVRFTGNNTVAFRNSITWGNDETASWDASNVAFIENIVAEGLAYSIHPISASTGTTHSYGGIASGSNQTYQLNLWMSSRGRMLRIDTVNGFDGVNNWTHNWGFQHWILRDRVGDRTRGNLINNLFTRGQDSNNELIVLQSTDEVYIEGNSVGAEYKDSAVPATSRRDSNCPPVNELPLNQVAAAITATTGAGATIAQGRDATDNRLIKEANSGGGQIRDCVNGLQATSLNNNCAKSITYNGLQSVDFQPLIDSNQVDGVPNTWKLSSGGAALHGENYNTHKFDSNSDGYTDFEDWVFGVFGM